MGGPFWIRPAVPLHSTAWVRFWPSLQSEWLLCSHQCVLSGKEFQFTCVVARREARRARTRADRSVASVCCRSGA